MCGCYGGAHEWGESSLWGLRENKSSLALEKKRSGHRGCKKKKKISVFH